MHTRPHFYQTRSAWSMDQGSTKKRSAVHNFVPTVTKFCVMWEGLSLPHDTKFGNCRGETVDRRVIFIWSLIHGSSWSGLIKVGPEFNGCGAVYVQYQLYLNASDRGAHGAMVMMCIAFTDLGCGQCPARSVSDTKVTTSPHQNITLQMFYRGGGVSVKCIDILGAIDITRIHNSLYNNPFNPYFPILQIEVWTKWPTFCRLHFQMQFRDWKFDYQIDDICFLWNNVQYHREKNHWSLLLRFRPLCHYLHQYWPRATTSYKIRSDYLYLKSGEIQQ